MTTTATIQISGPLPYQQEIEDRPEPTKITCWSRRSGKTRSKLRAAVLGHGPRAEDGEPIHKGLRHGLDIVWLTSNFKQGKIVWDEDIVPLFSGLADINEQEMTCKPFGMGTLYIRSAHTRDAVNSILGMGKNLGGVVIDEAAYLDLEYALKYVVLPMLLDRGGWLWVSSTPHMGSYFNQLCFKARANAMPRTAYSHATFHQNTTLSPERIKDLEDQYQKDSPEYKQQCLAELLEGGAGLAYPEFNPAIHVRVEYPERLPPGLARWFAGMDWGYDEPGWIGMTAALPGGRLVLRWEMQFRQLTPYEVGAKCALEWQLLGALPEFIGYDSSMSHIRDGGPTITEEFQRGLTAILGPASRQIALVPAPRTAVGEHKQRRARQLLLHEKLRVRLDEHGHRIPWSEPQLTIHPDCPRFIECLAVLPLDPKTGIDVDTRANDHAWDGWTYGAICREPRVAEPLKSIPADVHPGTLITGERRSRDRTPWTVMRERSKELAAQGLLPRGRYGLSPRSLRSLGLDPEDM